MPPRNPELPEGTDHIINGAMDTGAGAGGTGGGGTGGLSGSTGSGLGGSTGGTTTGTTGTTGGTSTGTTTGAGTGTGTGSGTSNIGGGFVASSGSDDTGGTSTGRSSGGSSSGGSGSGGSGSTTQKLADAARSQVSTLTDQATGKVREYADQGKERATSALDDFAEVINDAARSIDERLGSQYGEYAHRAAGAVTSISQDLRGKSIDELLDDSRNLVRKSPGMAIGAAALVGFTLVRLVKAGLDNDNEVQFTSDRGRNIDFQADTGGTSGRSA
jgi:hypothetical protein